MQRDYFAIPISFSTFSNNCYLLLVSSLNARMGPLEVGAAAYWSSVLALLFKLQQFRSEVSLCDLFYLLLVIVIALCSINKPFSFLSSHANRVWRTSLLYGMLRMCMLLCHDAWVSCVCFICCALQLHLSHIFIICIFYVHHHSEKVEEKRAIKKVSCVCFICCALQLLLTHIFINLYVS